MKPPEKPSSSQLDLWSTQEDSVWEDYKVAREYVRSLRLKNQADWERYANGENLRDTNIPAKPEKVYHNRGWVDWNDWLGTREPAQFNKPPPTSLFDNTKAGLWSYDESSKWMNFCEARQLVREYGFEYEEAWELFIDGKFTSRKPLPDNIPGNPDQVYRFVGWKTWKDWLVHPENQIAYSNFYRAREFVRSCRISDKGAWRDFLKGNAPLIKDYHFVLPLMPHLEYMDSGWKDWNDWLGTDIEFLDLNSSRKFVHTLKLKDKKEWRDFCNGRLPHKPKKSGKLYSYPDLAFQNEGWKGWEDWLGKPQVAKTRVPEPETSEIIIDCKCGGRIKDCQQCDGKGYYSVHLSNSG